MSLAQELFNRHKGKKCFWKGISAIVCGYNNDIDCIIIGFEEQNDCGWEYTDDNDEIHYRRPFYHYVDANEIINVVGGESRMFKYPIEDNLNSIANADYMSKEDKIKALSEIRDQVDGLLAELNE